MKDKKEGIYCLVQHVKAYKEQSDKGEVSDFGKPCAECQKREMCDYDWLAKTDNEIMWQFYFGCEGELMYKGHRPYSS